MATREKRRRSGHRPLKPPRRPPRKPPRKRVRPRKGPRRRSAPRKWRLEKPAARRVVKRAEAPEDRDRVQDDVEERLRARAPHARVDEHELEPVGPVEQ